MSNQPQERTVDPETGEIEESDLFDAREDDARMAESLKRIASKPDPETFYERGRLAREKKEGACWELGDIAAEFVTVYGANQMDNFAREVGLAKKTAQEYRRMSIFYEMYARASFLRDHPNVFYSHFRQAKVLPTPPLAYEWLELVSEQGYTVDEAGLELDKWMRVKGLEPDEDDEPTPEKVVICDGFFVYPRSLMQLHGEWMLTIVVKEPDAVAEQLKRDIEEYKFTGLKLKLSE